MGIFIRKGAPVLYPLCRVAYNPDKPTKEEIIMAQVKKDIKLMKSMAAKEAQRAADLRKAGKGRQAKIADKKARGHINEMNKARVKKGK